MIQFSGKPTILNVTIAAGNTWTSVGTLPTNGKAFTINCRSGTAFDYAYSAAPSTYMRARSGIVTVALGCVPSAIYVRQSGTGDIIETEIWT